MKSPISGTFSLNRVIFCIAVILSIAIFPSICLAQVVPDEIIIKFKPGKASKMSVMTTGTGIKVKRSIEKLGYYTLKLPKGADLDKTIARYKNDPSVEYVGPNHTLHIVTNPVNPNDAIFNYGLTIDMIYDVITAYQWGLDAINAPMAWNISTGSTSSVIAVTDTGLDYTHPDLASKMWTNPNEIAGNGIDDDHNGYIDDVHGWDLVNNDNDPRDDYEGYHGSFVSGIAAAATNNSIGIAGVSWGSKILPIKVMDSTGYGSEDVAAQGVVYAVDMGVKVINMSIAGDDTPLLHQAIDYAWNHGAICICASGNEGKLKTLYPAGYDNALAVGATDDADNRWQTMDMFGGLAGSNYGNYIDVMAPGSDIVSTSRYFQDFDPTYEPYSIESGTSASAPFVSGLAALLWSAHPDWTNQEIVFQIEHSATDIGNTTGWDIETGWGRIDAYAALSSPISVAPTPGIVKSMASGTSVSVRGQVLSTSSTDLPNRLYIQDEKRSSGVLLYFTGTVPTGFAIGDRVNVLGVVGKVPGPSGVTGERCIMDPFITKVSSGVKPKPLAMSSKTTGGGRMGLQGDVVDSYFYPQKMSSGLNNIGLLVTVFGKVEKSSYGYFYINDGCNLDDGSGDIGIRVECPTLAPPARGKYVSVTGISSCDVPTGSNARRRILRPRIQTDIKIIK